jgi:hypothetical protein
MAFILKQGSKGKPVELLQKFLNLKAKLPKPIDENGVFGRETKEAVRNFQKKAGLKQDGEVGSDTASALAKLVGTSAASWAKPFGTPAEAEADEEGEKGGDGDTLAAKTHSKPGKFGNLIHDDGNYKISIPPSASGTVPLVVLFAGTTHIPPVFEGASAGLFKNAFLVFSEATGNFSEALNKLKPLLDATGARVGSISICGYSLGGIAAFREYGHANKAVGLIDPTTHMGDIAKLDNKAIFSCNPDNWSVPLYAKIVEAQIEAGKSGKAGLYERTTIGHGAYPKYFLAKFESSLI